MRITYFPTISDIAVSSQGNFKPTGLSGASTIQEMPTEDGSFHSQLKGDIFTSRGRFGNGTNYVDIGAEDMKSANFASGSTGWRIKYDGSVEFENGNFRGDITGATGHFSGTVEVGSIHIPDQDTTANSFHTNTTGNSWWGCTETNFNADNNNATAYVLKTGVAKFQNIILDTSVTISDIQSGSEIAIQGWQHDMAFTASDHDTVAWASGTITLLDGTTYSITGANTGNMTAITYIYLDIATSLTALQTTTTAGTAVGSGKILIAVAEDVASGKLATFQVFGGKALGGIGKLIVANDITANTITASEMNVGSLSAITADLGTITAGNITIDASGYIKGGQTAYNTGTGFWLGYDTDAYKFSIGNASDENKQMKWDGIDLIVNGSKMLNQAIYGDGSDGDVDINSGSFSSGPITNNVLTRDAYFDNLTLSGGNLNTAGYKIFCKETCTIDVGYKIERNGNDGGDGGNGQGGSTWGTAGTAGATLSTGTIYGTTANGAGGKGGYNSENGFPGVAGSAASASLGSNGNDGGKGGDKPASGGGGVKGAGGAATAPTNSFKTFPWAVMLYDFTNGSVVIVKGSAGNGGGGGGRGGSGGGSGGGGGGAATAGGNVFICARKLVLNGIIEAKGGDGGNGGDGDEYTGNDGAGGGGGGAPGDGGIIFLIYNLKSGSGSTSVVAGTVGTGGLGDGGWHNGNNGSAGSVGEVIELEN